MRHIMMLKIPFTLAYWACSSLFSIGILIDLDVGLDLLSTEDCSAWKIDVIVGISFFESLSRINGDGNITCFLCSSLECAFRSSRMVFSTDGPSITSSFSFCWKSFLEDCLPIVSFSSFGSAGTILPSRWTNRISLSSSLFDRFSTVVVSVR